MKITKGKQPGAVRVVIYGPEGIGKSTLASKFPDPLFIDTEGSTKQLDVARTEQPKLWADLIANIKEVANTKPCKTLVIDTADWAENIAIDAVCREQKVSGIEDIGYGKGYTFTAEKIKRMLSELNECIRSGINVVIVAHAKMRKFEQPDEAGAYDRWELKLTRQSAPLVKEWADAVFFCNYKTVVITTKDDKKKATGGKRVIYTSHHPCWDAKNRFGLEEELPMDFKYIHHILPDPDFYQPQQSPNSTPTQPQPEEPAEVTAMPLEEDEVDSGIPKELRELMKKDGIQEFDIQTICKEKGWIKSNANVKDYPTPIIDALVKQWPKVVELTKKMYDDIPFN